ncbi:MAG: DUF4139 domain-containing protein [bacterium]
MRSNRKGFLEQRLWLTATVALLALTLWAEAKVDLVTLPGRDSVQVSIYNSEDLTLVRESRRLTFKKGDNELQFSWANTLIDPTSLDLVFKEKEDNFKLRDVVFPSGTQNTLVWHIEAKESLSALVEISYFTSGLTWAADYVVKASPDETKMSLEAYVKVVNNSGEDYENTQTRLVVGTINLVEKIADLARRGIISPVDQVKAMRDMYKEELRLGAARLPAGAVAEAAPMRPKEIAREGVSEYYLYTVEGTEDIKNTWAKRLPAFQVADIPFTVSYEYDDQKYGEQVIKFYKLKNNEEAKLGKEPLPDGVYQVFRENEGSGLSYINRHSSKYIPIGEDIELNLGPDGLLTFEAKQMNYKREEPRFDQWGNLRGWDIIEDWRLEIRNSKNKDVPLEITRHFNGDWEIKTDAKYERKDKDTLKFKTTIPALGTQNLDYTITTHFGTRSQEVNK